jgi:hypothetical protein
VADTRVTEDGDTRVTEDGDIRITNDDPPPPVGSPAIFYAQQMSA